MRLDLASKLILLNDNGPHRLHAELAPMACELKRMSDRAPIKIKCACGKTLKYSRTSAMDNVIKAQEKLRSPGVVTVTDRIGRPHPEVHQLGGGHVLLAPEPPKPFRDVTGLVDLAALASPLGRPSE